MTEPGAGWLARSLNWNKFTLDHFAIDCYRLEVSEFVNKFPITLLTTKVVNTILDCITLHTMIVLKSKYLAYLSLLKLVLGVEVSRWDHSTCTSLNYWQHRLRACLKLDLDPF